MNTLFIASICCLLLSTKGFPNNPPSFFPDSAEEQSPTTTTAVKFPSSSSSSTNSTEIAIDAIVKSARSGRQLDVEGLDEKFSQIAGDESVRQKLASEGEAEARGFIRDKLCGLGLCEDYGHQGQYHHGHGLGGHHGGHLGHGIPAKDVTLVQPVAIKPVGGPIAAVPLGPSKYGHGQPPFIPGRNPGFGQGHFPRPGGPQVFPGPGPYPGGQVGFPGAHHGQGGFGGGHHGQGGFGGGQGGFGGGPIVTPIVKPIYPGKAVDTHVHHHIHHNQVPIPGVGGGFIDDGYYGAAQRPAVSIASPSGKGLGGFGQNANNNNCPCLPYHQCQITIQPEGTQFNPAIQGTGIPNSGLVGLGIDPRNSKGAGIESNYTAAEDNDEEAVQTTTEVVTLNRQRRETTSSMEETFPGNGGGKSEPRQLNYNGDSCPRGQVACCQRGQQTLFQSGSSNGGNYVDSPISTGFPQQSEYGQCGKRQNNGGINGRVITAGSYQPGEGETDFGEYPWAVAILKSNGYVCGGSLIDAHHVATAAHCLKGLSPQDLRVRLGEWDVNSESEFYPFVERQIVSVVIHPEYYAGNLVNDLAILRMEDGIDFRQSPHISPVCLPRKEMDFTGSRCFVTGWGKDGFGAQGKFQNVLKKVDLPVLGQYECEQKLKRTRLGPDFTLNPGFLCAGGEEGKDACKGDGGGGLVCEVNNSWHLAGIVSWGVKCGEREVPGVYVKVSHYNSWINQVTGLFH